MTAAPAFYDARRIAEAAGLPPQAVEVAATIDSTNAALLGRPFGAQARSPRALIAVEQTAGRGRRGRPWAVQPRASLAMSVAVEREVDAGTRPLEALPLALGVAVAEALVPFGPEVALKWPNDLQLEARKAGGLLVEARRQGSVERIVIGLGLNLLPDAARDAAVDQPVAALFDEPAPEGDACGDGASGGASPGAAASRRPGSARAALPDRSELAGALVAAIVRACERCAAGGFGPFRVAWEARDALAGRAVRVLEAGGGAWEGVACGIDADGCLCVVDTAGTRRRVLAGEVSVRVAA